MANGLDIPCTIIFGGSRPVGCFGYSENINLTSAPECSPCWIHEGHQLCQHDLNCLTKISTSQVLKSINYSITNNSL